MWRRRRVLSRCWGPGVALETATGIDYPAFKEMSGGYNFIEGNDLTFPPADDLVVDSDFAGEHKLHRGDKVKLSKQQLERRGHCGIRQDVAAPSCRSVSCRNLTTRSVTSRGSISNSITRPMSRSFK